MSREQDLVVRAAAGDSIALKGLLTTSRPRLCVYISHRIPTGLGRLIDAEDIVQEAHIVVFRRISSFEARGRDSFFRWVAAIALSKLRAAIKRHRAAKRGGGRLAAGRMTKSIEDSTIALLDMLSGPGETPSRSVARREAVDAVQKALDEIPERYRQAVWLVHIEGRCVRDAACQIGRTERAIHGLCRRGLKLLEERLGSASKFSSSAT